MVARQPPADILEDLIFPVYDDMPGESGTDPWMSGEANHATGDTATFQSETFPDRPSLRVHQDARIDRGRGASRLDLPRRHHRPGRSPATGTPQQAGSRVQS